MKQTLTLVCKLCPTPDPIKSTNVIGADFGRRSIPVTSTGDEWDGKPIKTVRDKFAKRRASVEKKSTKGTRSSRPRCRQLLKPLSGKEQHFQSWLNHNISRIIIDQAKTQGAIVAIEDLTGIRDRTNTQPKWFAEYCNYWSSCKPASRFRNFELFNQRGSF